MNRSIAILLPALFACAEPEPLSSLDVHGDAMLAALPADTTLVVGGSLAELTRAPAVSRWLRPDHQQVNAALRSRTGLTHIGAVQEVRLGCGGHGCVALMEGNFASLDLGQALGDHPAPAGLRPHQRGADLSGPDGDWVVRRLGAAKAVAGDRRAVTQIIREHRTGRPLDRPSGLDPAPFAGLVPPGDLWLAAHSPRLLAAHVSDRARRSRDPAAAAFAATVEELAAELDPQLDRYTGAAASLTLTEPPLAIVRVRCADEATATTLAAALRLRAQASSPPPAVRAVEAIEQEGQLVQVSLLLNPGAIMEVSP